MSGKNIFFYIAQIDDQISYMHRAHRMISVYYSFALFGVQLNKLGSLKDRKKKKQCEQEHGYLKTM